MKLRSLAALVLVLLGAGIALLSWLAFPTPGTRYGPVIHEVLSEFSLIRVRERATVRSLLFVDEAGREQCQTSVDLANPGGLELGYTRGIFLSFLVRHPQDRVLILGLGGGGMVRFLNHHFPETVVEAVEIDPAVVKIARSHFGLSDREKTRLHAADAFDFIADGGGTFDAIYFDAFLRARESSGLEEKTRRLKTREFLGQVRDRIAPGGVVAFNLIAADPRTREDLAVIQEVFPGMARFAVPNSGNQVVIASRDATDLDQALLLMRAAEFDRTSRFDFAFEDLVRGRIE
jgi:spermidine synthase